MKGKQTEPHGEELHTTFRWFDSIYDSHTLDFIWKGLTIRFHFGLCMFIRQNVVRSDLV